MGALKQILAGVFAVAVFVLAVVAAGVTWVDASRLYHGTGDFESAAGLVFLPVMVACALFALRLMGSWWYEDAPAPPTSDSEIHEEVCDGNNQPTTGGGSNG